jgi:hypothetical protein
VIEALCPWCGKINTFEPSDEMLEEGAQFDCDHCKRPYEIAEIRRTVRLILRRV